MAAFDEIRVGDFYADVVPYADTPEPSTFVLLASGLIGLARWSRKAPPLRPTVG